LNTSDKESSPPLSLSLSLSLGGIIAQMGKGKKICGKKILLTKKGSDVKVVVTVVDMCPSKYCKFGQLDISRAAFKKFASLDKGIMDLTWKFLD
jgi:expansin (peptidoglycan-binding protein)